MPRARNSAAAAPVTLAAETAVVTVGSISPPLSGTVDILAQVDLSIGAAGTAATIRVRRGTDTTGTLIATVGPVTANPPARLVIPIQTSDTQNVDVSNQSYTVTVQQTAATGNGTANAAVIRADY